MVRFASHRLCWGNFEALIRKKIPNFPRSYKEYLTTRSNAEIQFLVTRNHEIAFTISCSFYRDECTCPSRSSVSTALLITAIFKSLVYGMIGWFFSEKCLQTCRKYDLDLFFVTRTLVILHVVKFSKSSARIILIIDSRIILQAWP